MGFGNGLIEELYLKYKQFLLHLKEILASDTCHHAFDHIQKFYFAFQQYHSTLVCQALYIELFHILIFIRTRPQKLTTIIM